MINKTIEPEIFEYSTRDIEHVLAMFGGWIDKVINSTTVTNQVGSDVLAAWASICSIHPSEEDSARRLSDYEKVYQGVYKSPDDWAKSTIDGFSGDWDDEEVRYTYFIRIGNNPWVYAFNEVELA